MRTAARRSRACCPRCGSAENVIRLVYGLPGEELVAQAKRGEIALGGCCVSGSDPNWYCNSCCASFGPPWDRPAYTPDEEEL